MSELPKEKSKRNYLFYLNNYKWECQYSVFYESYPEAQDAIEDSTKLRKRLIRAFSCTPFLYRLALKNAQNFQLQVPKSLDSNYTTMPWFSFLTPYSLPEKQFEKEVERTLRAHTRVLSRGISSEKIASISSAIKEQEPHNLNQYFGKKKINRFSALNKVHLVEKE